MQAEVVRPELKTVKAVSAPLQVMTLPRPRPYERQLSRDSTTGGAPSLPPLWEDSDIAAVGSRPRFN